MDDRFVVDYDDLYKDIEHILDELRVFRSNPNFTHIMGEEINRIKNWEMLMRRRLDEPFNIVIVGDFKRGKSSLVNALLGEKIVPTNVLPETITINRISYGEEKTCVAVLKNGKKAKLDIVELNKNELEEIMSKLPSEIEYVELTAKNELLKEIMIIDTPGLNDILERFDAQVEDYLKYADAIIYVISAKSPLSQTEIEFLSMSVMPQSFSRFFLVVNMADSLDNIEDIEKISNFTRDKIKNVAQNAEVFAVSALDEYCRVMDLPRPVEALKDYLENNFEYLRMNLQNDIVAQREVIKSTRAVTLGEVMLNDVKNRINLLLGVLSKNIGSLSEMERQYLDENSALQEKAKSDLTALSTDIDEYCHEADRWMTDFFARIKKELIGIKDTATTVSLQKHFQFYITEMLKSSIEACTVHHQERIKEKMKDLSQSFSEGVLADTGGINSIVADSITDISISKGDIAGFYLFSFSFATPLLLPVSAIAGFIRQRVVAGRQQAFLNPVLESFDGIIDEMRKELRTVYTKMRENASEKLNDFYKSQIEQSLSAIKQTKQILDSEQMKKDDVVNHLNGVLAGIADLEEILSKYRLSALDEVIDSGL